MQTALGRTTLLHWVELRSRMNKHRHNVSKGFIKHRVSRHASIKHNCNFSCFKLTPIEQISENISDCFGTQKRREMY